MVTEVQSAIEYRAARPEDILAVMRAQSLGFGGSTADDEIQKWVDQTSILPEWRLCAFDGSEPVSQIVVVPTRMNWNGREIGSAGVTDVFTVPTHRRRGIVRDLMMRAFAHMRDDGHAVAILEASMAAIYQRFGWAVVYTGLMHDFDPRHLRFVDEIDAPGRLRLVKHTEARPLIEPAYRRFAAARTLTFARGDFEWARALRFQSQGRPPPLVVTYEEDGETLGYAIYAVEQHGEMRPPPDQRLTIFEWVWLTPATHRGLVKYLAGHDLVDSVRMWAMPLDDPLFQQVQEPRWLQTRAFDGALARVVDVQAALVGRGYDGTGRLVLGVHDEYAPWNSGAWELTVDGGARVRRVDDEPQVRLTPRVLALLVAGTQPATVLARGGLIDVLDPSALDVADALFRTSHVPVCLDHWM
jgi:predicted acetyltransferase